MSFEYHDGRTRITVSHHHGAVWVYDADTISKQPGFRVPDVYVNDFNVAIDAAIIKLQAHKDAEYQRIFNTIRGSGSAGIKVSYNTHQDKYLLTGLGAIGGTTSKSLVGMTFGLPVVARIMRDWLIPDDSVRLPALWLAQKRNFMQLGPSATVSPLHTQLSRSR